MALREISRRKGNADSANAGFVDPGKFAVGETIEGNFLGFKPRVVEYKDKETGKQKKFTTEDVMIRGTDGKEFPITAKGTFKYLKKDSIETKELKLGDYVVFTCWRADSTNPRFNVAVDDDKAIKVEERSDF